MLWRADTLLRHAQVGIAGGSHAQAQQPGTVDSPGVDGRNGLLEEHEVLGRHASRGGACEAWIQTIQNKVPNRHGHVLGGGDPLLQDPRVGVAAGSPVQAQQTG
jgi:hypothetical protein